MFYIFMTFLDLKIFYLLVYLFSNRFCCICLTKYMFYLNFYEVYLKVLGCEKVTSFEKLGNWCSKYFSPSSVHLLSLISHILKASSYSSEDHSFKNKLWNQFSLPNEIVYHTNIF